MKPRNFFSHETFQVFKIYNLILNNNFFRSSIVQKRVYRCRFKRNCEINTSKIIIKNKIEYIYIFF